MVDILFLGLCRVLNDMLVITHSGRYPKCIGEQVQLLMSKQMKNALENMTGKNSNTCLMSKFLISSEEVFLFSALTLIVKL